MQNQLPKQIHFILFIKQRQRITHGAATGTGYHMGDADDNRVRVSSANGGLGDCGVAMKGGSAEAPYYDWVDQFDTLGLGKNIPIATGNLSEALLALKDGKWVTLRVPYPMGFFAKGMDGRIDDAGTGWKGKGVYATYSGSASTHIEGGKGTTPKVIHFQLRPDPLAN